ncbi:MAG: FtsW/RodA/SpoVE family cell cycle protein [Anaerobutyricum sp.]
MVGQLFTASYFCRLEHASHGSQSDGCRWVRSVLQPSETCQRLRLNLFLAAYISSKCRDRCDNGRGLLEPFHSCTSDIVGIVGIENLSTCIILLAISFIMIFVATPSI